MNNTLQANTDIKTALKPSFADTISGWKVRWGFGRMSYRVEPGLYKAGNPDNNSQVIVTANYKLTFDQVIKDVIKLDVWVLVLDTAGVNVWCAAGKGTFGTEELVKQINSCFLSSHVSHRNIILPQLGASGVSGFNVKKRTGFNIIYGPVYSKDIREFFDSMFVKSEKMKQVKFGFMERAVLVPVEIYNAGKFLLITFAVSALYISVKKGTVDMSGIFQEWLIYAGSAAAGVIFVPLFLPFIPFKSFALKGAAAGFAFASLYMVLYKAAGSADLINSGANILIAVSAASYFALDFTGATTFTSLSGVRREIRNAVPFYAVFITISILLKIILLFI